MDGGAKNSKYAARIAAAFAKLEESGVHLSERDRQAALATLTKMSPVDRGTKADHLINHSDEYLDDEDALAYEVLDEDEMPSDDLSETPTPDTTALSRITFGMRRQAPATREPVELSREEEVEEIVVSDDAGDNDDVDDVVYAADRFASERYSTVDASMDIEDDLFQSDDDEENLNFFAERADLVLLLLRNTLLTILSFGLYRFWAQRNVRRYLWGAVTFQGEKPEYQGRATDSLLAFGSVSLLVILLAGLLIVLPQLVVPLRPINAGLELFFVAGLFLTLQVWSQWRRRYNLDHTAWHGIRFERSPQSIRRLLPILGVWSLVLLTAGLAYPLARVICARDLFKDVRFGPASVLIEANAQPLLLPWAIVYTTLLVTFVVVGTELVFDYQTASGAGILLYWLGSAALIIASFGALVWYKSGEFDYFVSSIFVGQSRASTDIAAWRILMKAALPVFGFLVFSLSFFLLAFFTFGAFFQLTAEKAATEIDVNYLLITLGFVATLIGGFIYQVLLNLFRLDLINHIVANGRID